MKQKGKQTADNPMSSVHQTFVFISLMNSMDQRVRIILTQIGLTVFQQNQEPLSYPKSVDIPAQVASHQVNWMNISKRK